MTSAKVDSTFLVGVILGVLGAICFSTKAIFVKLAYRESDVDAITLLALRMLFALPFFIVSAMYASNKAGNVRFTGKQWLSIVVIGLLGYYVSSLLDFTGLKYISAGIERLVLFIYPTLVLLMSSLYLKTRITKLQWIAVALTYAGLLFAFVGEFSFDASEAALIKGSLLIFGCAITYAMYIVGSGSLIPIVGAAKFNSYAMTFAATAVLIHFFVASDVSLFNQSAPTYIYAMMMAVVSTVIPSYLIAASIKRVGADNTAIVASVGPVSTILQAYIFLQESIHAMQIAGTILIIVGVWLVGRKKAKAL